MRTFTLMVLMALTTYTLQGQHTVTGKIVDELGLPIYLAEISIESPKTTTYTDYEGNFTLTSDKDFHWKIHIKAAGYNTESFFVLDGGRTEDIVLPYNEEMRALLEDTAAPKEEEKKTASP